MSIDDGNNYGQELTAENVVNEFDALLKEKSADNVKIAEFFGTKVRQMLQLIRELIREIESRDYSEIFAESGSSSEELQTDLTGFKSSIERIESDAIVAQIDPIIKGEVGLINDEEKRDLVNEIGHHFGNALSFPISTASLYLDDLPTDTVLYKMMFKIRDNCRIIDDLKRKFIWFFDPVDRNEELLRQLEEIRDSLGGNVIPDNFLNGSGDDSIES